VLAVAEFHVQLRRVGYISSDHVLALGILLILYIILCSSVYSVSFSGFRWFKNLHRMIFQICNRPDTTDQNMEMLGICEHGARDYFLGVTRLNLPQIEMVYRLVIIIVFILYGSSIFF
jgi:hypothetical protein